jgi:DNA-binding protein YbaB
MSGQQRRQADQTSAELRYSDPHRAFEKAMEELRLGQERLKSVRQKLEGQTTKVTSKDGMISITLDAAGEVTSIAFNTQKWRRMAPAELGAVLVEALRRARAQGRARLVEAYRPLLPEGLDPAKIMSGQFSVDGVFESARERSERIIAAAKSAAGQSGKG